MSSDSARSPEDAGDGPPCPLEIFNEFQMDVQDPGSGSTPFLRACSQLDLRGAGACRESESQTHRQPSDENLQRLFHENDQPLW